MSFLFTINTQLEKKTKLITERLATEKTITNGHTMISPCTSLRCQSDLDESVSIEEAN